MGFPTISFKAKQRGGQLVITVVGCNNLPDLDAGGIGFGNKTDAYVKVKAGRSGEEHKTNTKSGNLNPTFDRASSQFAFNVSSGTRIYFTVMDKDTVSKDDLVGTASVKLTSGQLNGVLQSLVLAKPEDNSSDSD